MKSNHRLSTHTGGFHLIAPFLEFPSDFRHFAPCPAPAFFYSNYRPYEGGQPVATISFAVHFEPAGPRGPRRPSAQPRIVNFLLMPPYDPGLNFSAGFEPWLEGHSSALMCRFICDGI